MATYKYDASVAAQQVELNKKGANLKVDGFLGPLTQAAITKYAAPANPIINTPVPAPILQSQVPVNTSQKFDIKTGALNPNYIDPAIVKPVVKAPAPTVFQQGIGTSTAPNENVRAIQKQLGITTDGIFGPQTKSAIMSFQQANGLVVDGIVGPKTQAVLQKAATDGSSTTGTTTPSTTAIQTTKAPDDPTNQFNTVTGQPNPNYKAPGVVQNPQAEIAGINDAANADMQKLLEGFKTSVGESVDVSNSDKLLKALTESIATPAPKAPSILNTYNDQRAKLGVGVLEDSLASITSEEEKLDSEFRALGDKEDNKAVSMGLINSRKSQEQINYDKAKEDLRLKKNSVINQLNQKYSVIDNIVKYTQADAQEATQEYTTKFNQAVTLTNLMKNIDETKKSNAEKEKDNARANVQIMMNTLKDKNIDFTKIDPKTTLDLKNLEIQAGLPTGFVQFALQATDQPVISIGGEFTNAGGQRQVPIYTKNSSTGVVETKVITIGTSGVTPTGTDEVKLYANMLKTGVSPNGTKVGNPKGADGFVDPGVYTAAFQSWTGTTATFLSKFPVKTNVNPASYKLLPAAIRPTTSTRELPS